MFRNTEVTCQLIDCHILLEIYSKAMSSKPHNQSGTFNMSKFLLHMGTVHASVSLSKVPAAHGYCPCLGFSVQNPCCTWVLSRTRFLCAKSLLHMGTVHASVSLCKVPAAHGYFQELSFSVRSSAPSHTPIPCRILMRGQRLAAV